MDQEVDARPPPSPSVCIDKQLDNYFNVTLQKKAGGGFGFNIVGGTDNPHIPGYNGFFISRINPNSDIAIDRLIEVGDSIIAVNDEILEGKTHQEAVDIFRAVTGSCVLKVEKQAERRILDLPALHISSTPIKGTCKNVENGNVVSPDYYSAETTPEQPFLTAPNTPLSNVGNNNKTGQILLLNNAVSNVNEHSTKEPTELPLSLDDLEQFPELPPPKKSPPFNSEQNQQSKKRRVKNSPSTQSNAGTPEMTSNRSPRIPHYSVSDNLDNVSLLSSDLQKTPKRTYGPFDLHPNSLWAEVIFVSIGTIALGAAIFVGYKYFKKR